MSEEIPRQTVDVRDAEPHMQRPVKVAITEHFDERNTNSSAFFLTREEAWTW